MTAGLAGHTLGRYRLINPLGAGRQGTVYRAYDPVIDRPVAVKVAHAGASAGRMFVEAQMAATLQHPNIVAVFDAGSEAGIDFIVTELVPQHVTANTYVDSDPALRLVRALAVVRQCGEALAHAHARGVLHRDIKPSNVLIDSLGQVRLTDFGLALPNGGSPGGGINGTAAYLAPEAGSHGHYSEASDLYALGVVLFELLAGRLPFPTDSADTYRKAQAAGTACSLADLHLATPAVLQRVLDRCLALRPELRYRSAADLIGDLMVVQECITPTSHTELDADRTLRLIEGAAGLRPEEAATLARLADWRRLARGQRLPALAGGAACLVWVTLGSLALHRSAAPSPEAGETQARRIPAGRCLLLSADVIPRLVAREECELLLLDEAQIEHLPVPLQLRLLYSAALGAWLL